MHGSHSVSDALGGQPAWPVRRNEVDDPGKVEEWLAGRTAVAPPDGRRWFRVQARGMDAATDRPENGTAWVQPGVEATGGRSRDPYTVPSG